MVNGLLRGKKPKMTLRIITEFILFITEKTFLKFIYISKHLSETLVKGRFILHLVFKNVDFL